MSSEVAKGLQPTKEVLKRLYALSGNICAFPNCKHALFDIDGVFVAQLCHIEAAEPGGSRFNAASNNEARRALENLMLMCHRHHKVTDNVGKYSVDRMRELKATHESKYAEAVSKILATAFADVTEDDQPVFPKTLKRFGKVLKTDPDESLEFIVEYANRLSKVPRNDRALLCIFLKRDLDGEVRASELEKATATGHFDLADSLRLLEKYDLLSIDLDEYGDRNPVIRIQARHNSDYNAAFEIRKAAQALNINLERLFRDMNFGLLD